LGIHNNFFFKKFLQKYIVYSKLYFFSFLDKYLRQKYFIKLLINSYFYFFKKKKNKNKFKFFGLSKIKLYLNF
jgi:hypothetical protein